MNERRVALMRMLDSRKKYTARELAERFDVSVRTIQRDLDYLQRTGLPLYTEQGPHGGYRALPNRLLPPLHLSRDEAMGLFLMLKLLEDLPDIPFGEVRAHLSEHYYAELPDDVQQSIDQLKQHVSFRMMPTHAASPYTTLILEASINQVEVKMHYRSASGERDFLVFPIGLYFEHGYWYMPAYHKDRIILFRADRVMDMILQSKSMTNLPSLRQWLAASDDREGENAVIQFTDLGVRMAESDPLFQKISNGVWCEVIPEQEYSYVARLLLKYGPEAEVIEPKALRDMVRQLFYDSLQLYDSSTQTT
ncbi:helix-turn-helix transcriptional regulator [Paenibacillus chibensis]|uniref:helix-turn-helix transcriptional regulator n=1 Tax=Paenibacillus chibensis TaxID=59846 RepID=UPI000FDABB31|nr:YafY family protein [Paenibacillus chibensis]MEC0371341.1 YafY family protein [Paenibacillus chibensis]